jgi:hypothetical protein
MGWSPLPISLNPTLPPGSSKQQKNDSPKKKAQEATSCVFVIVGLV